MVEEEGESEAGVEDSLDLRGNHGLLLEKHRTVLVGMMVQYLKLDMNSVFNSFVKLKH